MRLVCTLNDSKQAMALSTFLNAEGIENKLEIIKETNWGSHTYGDVINHIWIINEDDVQTANKWIDLFKQNPNDPSFYAHSKSFEAHDLDNDNSPKSIKPPRRLASPNEPLGVATLYLIILCCILFFITEITAPAITSIPPYFPTTPLFSAPLKKKLLYDYPQAYEIVDKLVDLYGLEGLRDLHNLPPEGKALVNKYSNTPYWQGYYAQFLNQLQGNETHQEKAIPMFEKIRQGEFWRLISPCFMHSDILHILFNLIWLIILGKQLEKRLGIPRYLLFILLTGVFSNTAQYLMGGPNFLGISGVICGMLTFIWARQQVSAWEGYQLEKSTMLFMTFFILSMFCLQLISFYFEANQQASISPGIANTAHLSGAFLGYILGRLSFFRWKV